MLKGAAFLAEEPEVCILAKSRHRVSVNILLRNKLKSEESLLCFNQHPETKLKILGFYIRTCSNLTPISSPAPTHVLK